VPELPRSAVTARIVQRNEGLCQVCL
jgi:hypothetical protein